MALGAAENNFAYDVRACGGLFGRVESLENASPCFGGHAVPGVNRIKHFRDPSEEPRAHTRWVNAFEIVVLQAQARSASPPGKPICGLSVTLVASGLPTFCSLPLAKYAAFA